jgi:1,4-dihydroxy-2-naphthoyl-CoA hydrolase
MEELEAFRDDFVGLQKTLGIHTVEASQERVIMEMDIVPRVQQHMGLLHGGASAALAESAAWTGSSLRELNNEAPVVTEINVSHLRTRSSGKARATARLLARRSDSDVWEVRIQDEMGKDVAVARCTVSLRILPPNA